MHSHNNTTGYYAQSQEYPWLLCSVTIIPLATMLSHSNTTDYILGSFTRIPLASILNHKNTTGYYAQSQ